MTEDTLKLLVEMLYYTDEDALNYWKQNDEELYQEAIEWKRKKMIESGRTLCEICNCYVQNYKKHCLSKKHHKNNI